MEIAHQVEHIINPQILPPGTRVYTAGNASTPRMLLQQIVADRQITDIELISVLLLGDIQGLFSNEVCERVTHRIIFSGPWSRNALNTGRATYHVMHLSDIPHQVSAYLPPDVVFLSVSGPDRGGNFSYGTAFEALPAAVAAVRQKGGLVIAERNQQMPFVLGATLDASQIDYLIDTDYALPLSPVPQADAAAQKIGRLISELYISDGCTLQYGIGKVPEAVTDAIIDKGVRDLGIYTELFSDAMRKLVERNLVTNRYCEADFSISTLFLSSDAAGYEWLDMNSSVQGRPCNQTNSILNIARQHRMRAINSAIGVDLHGNVWADSLKSRQIYSGIGGQADFLRGSSLAEDGLGIIAMESTTSSGISKIIDMCPEGITTTAIAADPVVIVTENGAFNPRGLTLVEHAIGIAHLAEERTREALLRKIYDSPEFFKPRGALRSSPPKGFIAYASVFS